MIMRYTWNEIKGPGGGSVFRAIGAVLDVTPLKEARERLEEGVKELRALYEMSAGMRAARGVKEVAAEALKAIKAAVGPDTGLFFLLRSDGRFELVGHVNDEADFSGHLDTVHRLGECLCGLSGMLKEPLFSLDITKDLRCTRDECKAIGLRSMAVLPLVFEDTLLGVINLGSFGQRDFETQAPFLMTLANEATIGLKNALLIDELIRHEQELEALVKIRTERLEEANRELEAFTYSVSHDLRAPLRAVEGLSRVLEEDYGEVLDQGGKDLLVEVGKNARRMKDLINDLLEFSRLGKKAVRCSEIDMEGLAREVFYELTTGEQRRGVEFVVEELPRARGDPALVRQVLHNLISNAIKFSSTREIARIRVGFVPGGRGEKVYYVRDNGIGFEMKHAPRLFGLFQRLHSVEEYEGTGVGLSIVERIVRRHGGRVWAEGSPGRGAVFYFALPGDHPEGDAEG